MFPLKNLARKELIFSKILPIDIPWTDGYMSFVILKSCLNYCSAIEKLDHIITRPTILEASNLSPDLSVC